MPQALPRLAGWWGNRAATRFEMREAFEPERGAAGWQVSCPSILSLAGLRAGLEEFAAARGWEAKRKKLTKGLARWAAALLPAVNVITPAARGAQVSFDLGGGAAAVQQKLRAGGIYSDVRGPVLRLSFHPLYNRYADVVAALAALGRALR